MWVIHHSPEYLCKARSNSKLPISGSSKSQSWFSPSRSCASELGCNGLARAVMAVQPAGGENTMSCEQIFLHFPYTTAVNHTTVHTRNAPEVQHLPLALHLLGIFKRKLGIIIFILQVGKPRYKNI